MTVSSRLSLVSFDLSMMFQSEITKYFKFFLKGYHKL